MVQLKFFYKFVYEYKIYNNQNFLNFNLKYFLFVIFLNFNWIIITGMFKEYQNGRKIQFGKCKEADTIINHGWGTLESLWRWHWKLEFTKFILFCKFLFILRQEALLYQIISILISYKLILPLTLYKYRKISSAS